MDLIDVIDEVRDALGTITGLRVPEWGEQNISTPAALVIPPDRIDYDETYGRGADRYPDLQVVILVDDPTEWRSYAQLAPYLDGAGAKSVKTAIEDYAFTACDKESVRLAWGEIDQVSYVGIARLAAVFHIELMGKGAE